VIKKLIISLLRSWTLLIDNLLIMIITKGNKKMIIEATASSNVEPDASADEGAELLAPVRVQPNPQQVAPLDPLHKLYVGEAMRNLRIP
jgi:hypothetical protein